MPLIIQDLIPEPQTLITITEDESAQHALSLMLEHEFSQLPVVDNQLKLKGMVTSDSLLHAVSNFKTIPEYLKVSHAKVRARSYRREDDSSELLKSLRENNAVPIVDKHGLIEAIVTSYDAAEHFRKKSEDITYAEDIEATIKDIIENSHKNESGEIDTGALDESIRLITASGEEFRGRFRSALLSYIGQTTGQTPTPDDTTLDRVFERYLKQPNQQKPFESLTLHDFIQMLRNLWERHSADFKELDWDAVYHLLDDVRKTRNAIAHFREVTPQQRRQLQFCADFLDRHRPSNTVSIESLQTASTAVEITSQYPGKKVIDMILPSLGEKSSKEFVDIVRRFTVQMIDKQDSLESSDHEPSDAFINFPPEELDANDSRYAPLAIWLQSQENDRVRHSFKDIETIIGDELPPSAYNNRSWWANDRVGHVQSIQWLEAGWRVSSVNMSAERVTFSRMGDRQSAYIAFFNQLQEKLKELEGLRAESTLNTQGKSWSPFAIFPEAGREEKPPRIVFSFARRARFRMEIYISEKDRDQTKKVFDLLHAQKEEIESDFGASLSWERLNGGHASRIAYYRPNSSITDEPSELEVIKSWATNHLPKFYGVISDRFIAAQERAHEENARESTI